MPVHDWTRVNAGTWHAFHLSWIAKLSAHLNSEVLPDEYYAQAAYNERLNVQQPIIIAERTLKEEYVEHHIAIHKSSDDDVIALIELVSPGNKAGKQAIGAFVDKALEALSRGYHLLIVDLFPPGPRDPDGLPALIWTDFAPLPYSLPADEWLTISSYDAGRPKRLFVEITKPGKPLPDMPLFLETQAYVPLPLEATYTAAYRGVPRKWQQVLQAPA